MSAGLSRTVGGGPTSDLRRPPNLPAGGYPLSISIGGLTSDLIDLAVFVGPVITNVTNAASNITAGLPMPGIAQGRSSVLYGSNLGPGTIRSRKTPSKDASLADVGRALRVDGSHCRCVMYYTSATQVSALLPSNSPVGVGKVTVTYNGRLASPRDQRGAERSWSLHGDIGRPGCRDRHDADTALVSSDFPGSLAEARTPRVARPSGRHADPWATGLGPVNGSDAAGAGLGVNMTDVPLTLWLGGVQATVVYQGRSGCCIGEDQIVFVVPNNAPTGCSVPLAIQIGNQISNYTAMAVANKGSRTCTATNPAFTSGVVQLLTTNTGTIAFADLALKRQPNINGQGQLTGNTDTGRMESGALTVPAPLQPFIVSYVDSPPAGTCQVSNNLNGFNGGDYLNGVKDLDAGPSVEVTGPNGSQNVPVNRESNHARRWNFSCSRRLHGLGNRRSGH